MNRDLLGKTALVTGSTRGIGRAIAFELAKRGAQVILHGSSKRSDHEQIVDQLRQISPNSFIGYADVVNRESISTFAEEITLKGVDEINFIVNNAGITRDKTLHKMTYDEWDIVLKTNLFGPFNVIKQFMHLIPEGGRIINIASVNGQIGSFGQTNYAASKAGLIGLSKSLALELAKRKITVNCVAPGFTSTEMTGQIPEEIVNNTIMPKIPLRRFASPTEIAKLVAFLSGEDSGYITGQTIGINGGLF
ncbi:3-oxoacyl-ACP reductase FabG [Candidatus Woesebacteria bacterium]|nr:3-oxoacyl-ACP reductase FabG [Candidatus Woesebacteria bacterium]